jgi:hypothetical protein
MVDRCGLSNWEAMGHPAKVTIYALRHSDIVRQIRANVPLRIIAATHDTSVAMIERDSVVTSPITRTQSPARRCSTRRSRSPLTSCRSGPDGGVMSEFHRAALLAILRRHG